MIITHPGIFSGEVEKLVFHALNPDGSDIMTGVLVGTGGATDVRSAIAWVKDYQNFYQQYAVNETMWQGGRVTGAVGSRVVFANDGVSPVNPLPSVYAARRCINLLSDGDDFLAATWLTVRSPTRIQDVAGIRNTANSGWRAEDNSVNGVEYFYINTTVSADTSPYNMTLWLKKEVGITTYPALGLGFGTAGANTYLVFVDTENGTLHPFSGSGISGSGAIVDDGNGYWKVILRASNVNELNVAVAIYPAYTTDLVNINGAAVGIVTFDCAMLTTAMSLGRTAECSPVFTSGGAFDQSRSDIGFDIANHSDSQGAYYAEVRGVSEDAVLNLFLDRSVAGTVVLDDSVNAVVGPDPGDVEYKVGIAYGDGQMDLNVDNTWYGPQTYDGTLAHDAILDIFRANQGYGLMRNLRRYDNSYGKSREIIDGLMIAGDITWQFDIIQHDSAALGYVTEMCTLTPLLNGQPYPVRSCIFSLHGANGTNNSSFNHANRIRPFIEQAVVEGVIEPIKVVFPSNGSVLSNDDAWWKSPVLDMLENEIFPDEPTGFCPPGVIHRGFNGHSLGGGSQRIFNSAGYVADYYSSTATAGGVGARNFAQGVCTNLGEMYIVTHADDTTNPLTLQEFNDWIANTCGRVGMTGDRPTCPSLCTTDYHSEEFIHGNFYVEIWSTHQSSINRVAAL